MLRRPSEAERWARRREHMVEDQILRRGITDPAVLAAARTVPRHRFVPAEEVDRSHGDHPLPLAYGQTVSQPYIVAWMCELAALRPGDRVLEVGTGSGYQAAVLAEIGADVITLERIAPLAEGARGLLRDLGYDRVQVQVADGTAGWPEGAPYDAILVGAATPEVPEPLVQQLAEGGRLVLPVGTQRQELVRLVRRGPEVERQRFGAVAFVPLIPGLNPPS